MSKMIKKVKIDKMIQNDPDPNVQNDQLVKMIKNGQKGQK